MLRFIKHHLSTESNADFYGILGLIIFFSLFVFVIIRLLTMDKKHIEHLENIPFTEEETPLIQNSKD